jgi:[acyl-carrier-protein] S-malonyltransferase
MNMQTALVFPGQGAQFEGMGFDLYEQSGQARELFETADSILGFKLSEIMFHGSAEDLRQTRVTQPALFVHSIVKLKTLGGNLEFNAVAGHSLGEFSALVANGTLSFEDGLRLVYKRAMAMQKACDETPGTMAAVLGMEDSAVEEICQSITEVVVPANYNCPGQLVISGSLSGIDAAIQKLTEAGAKRALKLEVGGAFHSPLMESARKELEVAIMDTHFNTPVCPVYQNVHATAQTHPDKIRQNLIDQLTGAVRWTQTIQNMVSAGITRFVEVGGNGKVLSGLIKKVDKNLTTESL